MGTRKLIKISTWESLELQVTNKWIYTCLTYKWIYTNCNKHGWLMKWGWLKYGHPQPYVRSQVRPKQSLGKTAAQFKFELWTCCILLFCRWQVKPISTIKRGSNNSITGSNYPSWARCLHGLLPKARWNHELSTKKHSQVAQAKPRISPHTSFPFERTANQANRRRKWARDFQY